MQLGQPNIEPGCVAGFPFLWEMDVIIITGIERNSDRRMICCEDRIKAMPVKVLSGHGIVNREVITMQGNTRGERSDNVSADTG